MLTFRNYAWFFGKVQNYISDKPKIAKHKTLIKLNQIPKIPHNCCYAFGFLFTNKLN